MEPESQSRRRDRVFGLLIVGTAFLAALCISWWARGISSPSSGEVPGPPTADGVVGFPKKVDVVATLEEARTLTKRSDLRGISLYGVSSDGTVDVSVPGRLVGYAFTSRQGEGPQPVHPPGTLPKRNFCGKQNVRISGLGIFADPDQAGLPCTQTSEALPSPHCGPKQVWQAAIRHGMPGDQLATIAYFRAVAGPAWRFELPAQHRSLVLYGDCERELNGGESADATP
ncbi:MAG TPA: hypothetical protein VH062_12110 [Polyangiaceae bacterium]|nr:hypothetical protein [Polyangiaceae bacterium]